MNFSEVLDKGKNGKKIARSDIKDIKLVTFLTTENMSKEEKKQIWLESDQLLKDSYFLKKDPTTINYVDQSISKPTFHVVIEKQLGIALEARLVPDQSSILVKAEKVSDDDDSWIDSLDNGMALFDINYHHPIYQFFLEQIKDGKAFIVYVKSERVMGVCHDKKILPCEEIAIYKGWYIMNNFSIFQYSKREIEYSDAKDCYCCYCNIYRY